MIRSGILAKRSRTACRNKHSSVKEQNSETRLGERRNQIGPGDQSLAEPRNYLSKKSRNLERKLGGFGPFATLPLLSGTLIGG